MEITGFNLSFEELKEFRHLKEGDFFILHGKDNKEFDYRFNGYIESAQSEMHIFIKIPHSCYRESENTMLEFDAIDLDTQELIYMPAFANVRQIHGYIQCKNSDSEDEFLEDMTFVEKIMPSCKSAHAYSDFKLKADDCDKMRIPVQLNNFTHSVDLTTSVDLATPKKESSTNIPYLRLGVALNYKFNDHVHKWWDTIISTTEISGINGFWQYGGKGRYRYGDYDLKETGRMRNGLVQKIWF